MASLLKLLPPDHSSSGHLGFCCCRLLVCLFWVAFLTGVPLVVRVRGDTHQSQSRPFWISFSGIWHLSRDTQGRGECWTSTDLHFFCEEKVHLFLLLRIPGLLYFLPLLSLVVQLFMRLCELYCILVAPLFFFKLEEEKWGVKANRHRISFCHEVSFSPISYDYGNTGDKSLTSELPQSPALQSRSLVQVHQTPLPLSCLAQIFSAKSSIHR